MQILDLVYFVSHLTDTSLLKELSQDNVDSEKLDELVAKHMDLLKHVMKCKLSL